MPILPIAFEAASRGRSSYQSLTYSHIATLVLIFYGIDQSQASRQKEDKSSLDLLRASAALRAALLLEVFKLEDGDLDVPGTSVRGSILSFVDFSEVSI